MSPLTPSAYLKRPFFYSFALLVLISFYLDSKPRDYSKPELLGKTTTFQGKVIENQTRNQKSKLVVELEGEHKILLSIGNGLSLAKAGDSLEFTTKLKIPQNYKNPGGFDYVKYLEREKIGMTGFVENAESIRVLVAKKPSVLDTYKNEIRNFLSSYFNPQIASTLIALMWGEDDSIDPKLFDLFNSFGISHILVISGSHFALLTAAFFFIFRFLLNFFPRLFLYCPAQKITAGLTVLASTLYYFICENTPSLDRAYIAILAVLVTLMISRKNDWINLTFLSASLILLTNPLKLFDLSFQLSFLCVVAIIIVYPSIYSLFSKRIVTDNEDKNIQTKILEGFVKLITLNIAIFIVITPFVAHHFNRITWGSILNNLWVVPIMEMLVVPPALLGFFAFALSPYIAYWLFYSSGKILETLIYLLEHTQNTFTTSHLAFPPRTWELVLYFVLLFILFHQFSKTKLKNRLLSFIAIIFIIDASFWTYKSQNESNFKITQIDVGQGDSILVEIPPNKKILIDGGGAPFFDIGENVVIPFLLYKRISKLDAVVITHADTDHYAGLKSVIEQYPLDEIWWNGIETDQPKFLELIETIRKKKIPTKILKRGDTPIENIKVLWPPLEKEDLKDNNESIVLMIEANQKKALFTGDAEWPVEYELIKDDIKADYLKIGHHGSKTSSTELFLDKVAPTIATLGAKKGNAFGHPHKEVMERFEKREIKVYRTDQDGAIEISY